MTTVHLAVCLKWVAHPGEPNDERFSGMSAADMSALEFALRHRDHLRSLGHHARLTAVTVGPPGADKVVRDATSRGADDGLRVDAPTGADSADVAAALHGALGTVDWVWCGDYSADRGTGSVPAFLAAASLASQALGGVAVEFRGVTLSLTRRLDGGRREILEVEAPAVLSVEGATATLRRAALPAVRAAASATVRSVHPPVAVHRHEAVVSAYRPRARALPAPVGDEAIVRLRALTDAAAATASRGERLHADPVRAADKIIATLRLWGYLG